MNRARLFLKSLGPGLITGAADDDPSGIATYTIAGASFGNQFLWIAWLTWPMMAAVQMACAHSAMMTGHGLAATLGRKFSHRIVIVICGLLFFANTMNVGADLIAMAECAQILTGISSHIFSALFGVVIAVATVRLRYAQIAAVLKWLSLCLFAYIFAALLAHPQWKEVLVATVIPQMPRAPDAWRTLVALLGTTISPYLFFWQASQEVEEKHANTNHDSQAKLIGVRRVDVAVGTLFSNVVMFFIILCSSATLHRSGLVNIQSSKEAALALEPLAGHVAMLLYSLGLMGMGFLAIPTLMGSTAYAFADTFHWRFGLDRTWVRARAFYAVIVVSALCGIFLAVFNINPILALYWSAVLNGLLAPFLLLGIFLVIRDKTLMKGNPAPWYRQLLLFLTLLFMTVAGVAMFL